ncbi:hypothetical protein [Rhizobium sp. R339]|uniref:hypothetical protein n=1 Tax=Rhizobium sp. R339 TaxID=1764273 RepID=UPI00167C843C|nr:hypothetical protein [Rhizobium sp. R339]
MLTAYTGGKGKGQGAVGDIRENTRNCAETISLAKYHPGQMGKQPSAFMVFLKPSE